MNIPYLVVFTVFVSLHLTSATDLCEPCVHSNIIYPTRQEIRRFARTLGIFRHYVHTKQTYFANEHPITGSTLEQYINWPPSNPCGVDNDLIDNLMAAYGTLTDLDSNLKVFNDLRRVHTRYDVNQIKTPLCHLWKAVRSLQEYVPCTVCRKAVSPLFSASRTNETSYVYITLHRTLYVIDLIRHHFRNI